MLHVMQLRNLTIQTVSFYGSGCFFVFHCWVQQGKYILFVWRTATRSIPSNVSEKGRILSRKYPSHLPPHTVTLTQRPAAVQVKSMVQNVSSVF